MLPGGSELEVCRPGITGSRGGLREPVVLMGPPCPSRWRPSCLPLCSSKLPLGARLLQCQPKPS